MFRNLALAATFGALTATGAAAQSSVFSSDTGSFSTDGFFFYGIVDLSYASDSGFSDTFLIADLDFGILPAAAISGPSSLPIGFSLGFEAIHSFDGGGNSETALYPALLFAFGNNIIAVGNPRSVLDQGYFSRNRFAGSEFVNLQFLPFVSAIYSYVSLLSDNTGYGLRWDGTYGDLKVGASTHQIDDTGTSYRFHALAFRYQLAAISSFATMALLGGFEIFDDGVQSETSYRLGVEAEGERWRGAVSYTRSDSIGPPNTIAAELDYLIFNNFWLGATIINLGGSGIPSQTIYGIGAEYRFLENGYANVSFFDGDFGDGLWEVSVGARW